MTAPARVILPGWRSSLTLAVATALLAAVPLASCKRPIPPRQPFHEPELPRQPKLTGVKAQHATAGDQGLA